MTTTSIKIIKTICLIVFSLTINGQTVCLCDLEFIEPHFYNNNEIYSGEYLCYNRKGELKEKGYIKNGKLDSCLLYNLKGVLSEIIWFENNLPDKRRLFRNTYTTKLISNLKVVDQKTFIEHGLWERYYLNGQLKEQKHYDNGKLIGMWTLWDRKGRKTRETDFTNNPIVEKYYNYKNNDQKVEIYHIYIDEETKKKIKIERIE